MIGVNIFPDGNTGDPTIKNLLTRITIIEEDYSWKSIIFQAFREEPDSAGIYRFY
jgi:hypothetical protein